MRLYRGLKTPYRPERVGGTGRFFGTDFTDCPFTALQYASGRGGEVLVLDVDPEAGPKISEELWPGTRARRLMVWGRFDELLAGIFPAAQLRAEVRRKGIASRPDEYKAYVLESFIDKELSERGPQGFPNPAVLRSYTTRERERSRSARGRLTTSTVAEDGRLVPWLAATGPLSYTPENPPDRDYYFQYGWIIPDILADGTNRRLHYFFGASRKDARHLFSFWRAAREHTPTRLALCFGTVDAEAVTAPIAVYAAPPAYPRGPACVFMQHGSYQIVEAADQPLLGSDEVVLYRGLGEAETVRLFQDLDARDRCVWRCYVRVQADVLSDSVRSFNSIHDRAKRCETGYIRDRTWMSDDLARRHGLDIDADGFARDLWKATHESFSLARWVAERKFGPHYVVCRTPLDNIRLTTFFAGEHEVRIISPDRVVLLERHGCRVG
jgi:hypothetical protein